MLDATKVYPFESLPVKRTATGGEGRDVLHGVTATGEAIALHESMLPPGAPPNPAHRIAHSEVIMIQQGTVELTHDGVTEMAGPGGVLFVALGTLHQMRNTGPTPARYFVLAIGGDVKP
ncbi:cupin domain-containing protein [Granulicella rosea]|uniref:cupin domain-containing protein n=1 Tax=Granulicella rosea TaxID=474952 RepID=UPI001FE55B2B|nr:cupin domain-containing protein [Granulicella rosea]